MEDKLPSDVLKTLKQYEIISNSTSQVSYCRIYEGTINKNFQVKDGESEFLLKVFEGNSVLPINRKRTFRLQEELAIFGLAPQPLFLSEDATIYCEQWIDYKVMNTDSNLNALAEALHQVHSAFVSAPVLSLIEHWREYSALSKKNNSYSFQQHYQTMLVKWTDYTKQYSEDFVLCHNDLHISHVCSPSGPLLDWEYAGLGCRYFDIASCCIINQLNPECKKTLCDEYAALANSSADEILARVNQVYEFVEFTNGLWVDAVDFEQ